MSMTKTKTAVLYRMVTPEETCPFGLASRDLLRQQGFQIEEHLLTSREAVDEYKAREGVDTTPQTFIDGTRVGGFEELKRYFANGS